MTEIQEKLVAVLKGAAERLEEADLPKELAAAMEKLAGQVRERCRVAVVGQVKVGKSTFVNALLGGNLAKVGTTETTATINYFSHIKYSPQGEPPDLDRPVLCHWRGGNREWKDRAFLDGLQGYTPETLQRADGIDHLEYFLEDPFLDQVTLVDTPGTNAVVDEHQNIAAEYVGLYQQLRERHDAETQQLNRDADAVIYLTGAVAKAKEKEFLEEFAAAASGHSSALNAIGVMSKIELLNPENLDDRHELAGDIAEHLKRELNAVLPVGAGVRRALDGLLADDRTGLNRLVDTLRRIPPETLETLLSMDSIFTDYDLEESPVSAAERRTLLEELPEDARRWPIFTTVARVAADRELETLDEVEAALKEISNFKALNELLREHFIKRGHILRCYRVVRDAQKVLGEVMYTHVPRRKKELRQQKDRLQRFLDLIHRAGGDHETAAEMEDFVRRHLDVKTRVKELEVLYWELKGELEVLERELDQHNKDFEALKKLEEPGHNFTEDELNELQPLLGLYGSEVEKRLRLSPGDEADPGYARERQLYWKGKMEQAPFGSPREMVAERAFTRYGIVWYELSKRPDLNVSASTGG